ncbi:MULTISPECIES: GNAT family N-acetyltransferase [Halococcus]|uniref:N-acetyltransferase GCN5 n=1 Tax=Halococcus salifodinae DSM 8989 TaxID=1227456 RepID=M0MYK6_9EURY|nr:MULTISPECIES: GNAT family protein [Halococcus]EMA50807.1 N-acetyltransferase GCN5 [Halococcus salifodinae DSM 8989]
MPGPTFLEGDRITLRTVEEEDLDFLQRDVNDPDVWRSLGAVSPVNAEQEREWFEERSEGDGISLLICDDEEPVGSIGLSGINETWGHAEVGYWVTPDAWGEGYATAATELLVGYAFDQRRLNKLVANAFDFNAGSRRVLEKAGFAEEGVRREEAFIDGEFVDIHRYGLLAREWRADD